MLNKIFVSFATFCKSELHPLVRKTALPESPARGPRACSKELSALARRTLHPSLAFKKIGGENWSVRIGEHYRAMGKFVNDGFLWEWIGTHGEYDHLA